jgi:hypothetical protein
MRSRERIRSGFEALLEDTPEIAELLAELQKVVNRVTACDSTTI